MEENYLINEGTMKDWPAWSGCEELLVPLWALWDCHVFFTECPLG